MGKHNSNGFPDGDDAHSITLTHDEVLILFEFFERLHEKDELRFAHPAECLALGRFTGQLESIPWELFDSKYEALLAAARTRRSEGFEGHISGLGHVAVREDGSVVETPAPDAG